MPGMTSVSGKGRRDIEPANCIYETGSDCDKVRVRESAHGWAATVMSPAAGKLQVLGPKGPLLTNRMSELFTYGSVGGVGGNPGPYPATNRSGRSQFGCLLRRQASVGILAPVAHLES